MKRTTLLGLVLALSALPSLVLAAEKQIGQPCSSDQNSADFDTIAQCQSGIFVKAPLFMGSATGYACTGGANAGLVRWTGSAYQGCDGTAWRLIVTTATSATDDSPDAYSFTNLTAQSLGALILSNTLTITGINGGVLAQVTGSGTPEIRINGGAWVTAGTINSGETIQVRLTSSTSASTAYTATVAVGSGSGNWSVTTRAGQLKVFATSNSYNGNLGGLAGADAICQSEAATLVYSGSYKAILSDATTNAKDRLTIVYPVIRATDGVVVDATNIWDGSLQNYISSVGYIMTGTGSDGTRSPSYTCNSWTSGLGSDTGVVGYDVYNGNPQWIIFSPVACSTPTHLYCIQQ